jgi:hypothetical protein
MFSTIGSVLVSSCAIVSWYVDRVLNGTISN